MAEQVDIGELLSTATIDTAPWLAGLREMDAAASAMGQKLDKLAIDVGDPAGIEKVATELKVLEQDLARVTSETSAATQGDLALRSATGQLSQEQQQELTVVQALNEVMGQYAQATMQAVQSTAQMGAAQAQGAAGAAQLAQATAELDAAEAQLSAMFDTVAEKASNQMQGFAALGGWETQAATAARQAAEAEAQQGASLDLVTQATARAQAANEAYHQERMAQIAADYQAAQAETELAHVGTVNTESIVDQVNATKQYTEELLRAGGNIGPWAAQVQNLMRSMLGAGEAMSTVRTRIVELSGGMGGAIEGLRMTGLTADEAKTAWMQYEEAQRKVTASRGADDAAVQAQTASGQTLIGMMRAQGATVEEAAAALRTSGMTKQAVEQETIRYTQALAAETEMAAAESAGFKLDAGSALALAQAKEALAGTDAALLSGLNASAGAAQNLKSGFEAGEAAATGFAGSAGTLLNSLGPIVAVMGAIKAVGIAASIDDDRQRFVNFGQVSSGTLHQLEADLNHTFGTGTQDTHDFYEALVPITGALKQVEGGAIQVAKTEQEVAAAQELSVASGADFKKTLADVVEVQRDFHISSNDVLTVTNALYDSHIRNSQSIDETAKAYGTLNGLLPGLHVSLALVKTMVDEAAQHGSDSNRVLNEMARAVLNYSQGTKTATNDAARYGLELKTVDGVITVVNRNTEQLTTLQADAGRQMETIGGDWTRLMKELGDGADLVAKVGITIIKLMIDPVAYGIAVLESEFGSFFSLLGKAPGFGWAKELGSALEDDAHKIRDLISRTFDLWNVSTDNKAAVNSLKTYGDEVSVTSKREQDAQKLEAEATAERIKGHSQIGALLDQEAQAARQGNDEQIASIQNLITIQRARDEEEISAANVRQQAQDAYIKGLKSVGDALSNEARQLDAGDKAGADYWANEAKRAQTQFELDKQVADISQQASDAQIKGLTGVAAALDQEAEAYKRGDAAAAIYWANQAKNAQTQFDMDVKIAGISTESAQAQMKGLGEVSAALASEAAAFRAGDAAGATFWANQAKLAETGAEIRKQVASVIERADEAQLKGSDDVAGALRNEAAAMQSGDGEAATFWENRSKYVSAAAEVTKQKEHDMAEAVKQLGADERAAMQVVVTSVKDVGAALGTGLTEPFNAMLSDVQNLSAQIQNIDQQLIGQLSAHDREELSNKRIKLQGELDDAKEAYAQIAGAAKDMYSAIEQGQTAANAVAKAQRDADLDDTVTNEAHKQELADRALQAKRQQEQQTLATDSYLARQEAGMEDEKARIAMSSEALITAQVKAAQERQVAAVRDAQAQQVEAIREAQQQAMSTLEPELLAAEQQEVDSKHRIAEATADIELQKANIAKATADLEVQLALYVTNQRIAAAQAAAAAEGVSYTGPAQKALASQDAYIQGLGQIAAAAIGAAQAQIQSDNGIIQSNDRAMAEAGQRAKAISQSIQDVNAAAEQGVSKAGNEADQFLQRASSDWSVFEQRGVDAANAVSRSLEQLSRQLQLLSDEQQLAFMPAEQALTAQEDQLSIAQAGLALAKDATGQENQLNTAKATGVSLQAQQVHLVQATVGAEEDLTAAEEQALSVQEAQLQLAQAQLQLTMDMAGSSAAIGGIGPGSAQQSLSLAQQQQTVTKDAATVAADAAKAELAAQEQVLSIAQAKLTLAKDTAAASLGDVALTQQQEQLALQQAQLTLAKDLAATSTTGAQDTLTIQEQILSAAQAQESAAKDAAKYAEDSALTLDRATALTLSVQDATLGLAEAQITLAKDSQTAAAAVSGGVDTVSAALDNLNRAKAALELGGQDNAALDAYIKRLQLVQQIQKTATSVASGSGTNDPFAVQEQALKTQKDQLAIQRDELALHKAQVDAQQQDFTLQDDSLKVQQDALSIAKASQQTQQDVFAAQDQTLKVEQDRLAVAQAEMRVSLSSFDAQEEALRLQQDALAVVKAQQPITDNTSLAAGQLNIALGALGLGDINGQFAAQQQALKIWSDQLSLQRAQLELTKAQNPKNGSISGGQPSGGTSAGDNQSSIASNDPGGLALDSGQSQSATDRAGKALQMQQDQLAAAKAQLKAQEDAAKAPLDMAKAMEQVERDLNTMSLQGVKINSPLLNSTPPLAVRLNSDALEMIGKAIALAEDQKQAAKPAEPGSEDAAGNPLGATPSDCCKGPPVTIIVNAIIDGDTITKQVVTNIEESQVIEVCLSSGPGGL